MCVCVLSLYCTAPIYRFVVRSIGKEESLFYFDTCVEISLNNCQSLSHKIMYVFVEAINRAPYDILYKENVCNICIPWTRNGQNSQQKSKIKEIVSMRTKSAFIVLV